MTVILDKHSECCFCGCPLLPKEIAHITPGHPEVIACSDEHMKLAVAEIKDREEHDEYLKEFEQ